MCEAVVVVGARVVLNVEVVVVVLDVEVVVEVVLDAEVVAEVVVVTRKGTN